MAASIRRQMHADLATAMRARDATRVGVLRTTLGALANAEAVDVSQETVPAGLLGDVERRALTDDGVVAVIVGERDDLAATAAELRAVGQVDEAEELDRRAAVLDGYLAHPWGR